MTQKFLIEFIGVALLMYVYLITENPVAIGATLAMLLLITQNMTTAGFNPAIAIALASIDKIKVEDLIPYCVAQILGGFTAVQLFNKYKL